MDDDWRVVAGRLTERVRRDPVAFFAWLQIIGQETTATPLQQRYRQMVQERTQEPGQAEGAGAS